MNKLDAVILAGGTIRGSLQEKFPSVTNKAHIKINSLTMLEYILGATLHSTYIDKIFVVGDAEFCRKNIPLQPRITFLSDTGNIYENFNKATLQTDKQQLLVTSADIPLITSTMIDEFITDSTAIDGDIHYSVIQKEVIEDFDPSSKRTYARLSDGDFTGGNILLVKSAAIASSQKQIEHIFANRKNVFALAKMAGIKFLYNMWRNKVSLSMAEEKAGMVLGCKCRALKCRWAQIGIDVDKVEDWQLVCRHLS